MIFYIPNAFPATSTTPVSTIVLHSTIDNNNITRTPASYHADGWINVGMYIII